MGTIDHILNFWFQEAGPENWFRGGEAFDRLCRERLLEPHEQAAAGAFDQWRTSPDGCLALCLLLDQAPRNMFRGTPRMYATDAPALAVAEHALARSFDAGMDEDRRAFLYLPLEHSEVIDNQRRCLRLFAERTSKPLYLDYAAKHLVIVERFGRFPHRNAILGRETTAEEAQFLAMPGSGF